MSRSFGGGGAQVVAAAAAADEQTSLRQHRGRLMQLASSGSTKRRAYSAQHAVFKSAPTPRHSGIPGKLLSFEEVVRNDPSYTPNIEHLVFPSRRNSIPTKPGAVGGGSVGSGGGGKSARARLAEVFALTRSQGSRKAQSHEKSKSRENSITRSSFSQKVGGGGSERGVSGGGGEPVCSAEEAVSVNRSSASAAQSSAVSPLRDALESAQQQQPGSNRGPNVSVLHLRSTSEPWETAPVRSTAGGGSRRQHSQTAPPPKQKSQEQQQQQQQQHQNSGSNKVNRELSPVRWCDREVDGVYLGRSGWVQVQQRSLDDRKVVKYNSKTEVQNNNLHSRIKMADYHCSKSEPGKLPPPPLLRQEEVMTRPGYLPLPGEPPRRTKEKPSPSSLDLSHEEPITPPPVTPIISPPPAFQDTNKQRFDHSPRTRPPSKAPFLSRSNAVEISPPPSPPRSTFRTPDPKITAVLGGPIAARNRWFGPAPVTTQSHSAPPHQTKSLEESAAASSARRTLFQKYGDSSSSSSSSFGFRSLDNTLAARSLAMPRLTETDSSIGGYEDGYEEDNVITLVSSSPDSAERNDRSRQLLRQAARRSPGSSDGSGGNKLAGSHSSSTSSSDDGSRSPFRRPVAQASQGVNVHHSQANSHHLHTPKQQQQQQQQQGGNSSSNSARVRRSRSLQLPERKSPVSPAQQQQQQQQAYYTSKGYPVVVKVGADAAEQQQQQQRIKRHLLQQQRMSEEAHKREELLRREAEAVTEFLWSARSREAARALLSQRVSSTSHQQHQQQQQQPSFNVVFVGGGGNSKSQRSNNYGQQSSASSQRARGLQRGSSTPVSKGSSPVGGFCPNPCNPTTCDFWPHCAHRDGIYTTTKASTPVAPQPPTSLRLSQSYPNTATDRGGGGNDKRSRLEPNARHNYQSIRSSPASLERVDHDTAVSPDRHNAAAAAAFHTRRGNSLNVSPEWRSAVGPQCCQHLHPPRRSHDKPGFKVGLSDTSSSSVDAYQPRGSPGDTQTTITDKVSPIEVNSVIVNADDALSPSSSSSSSSEVWLTTSDRTLTKSDRTLSKSPRRTPQEETVRLPGSELESRPGSAPGGAVSQQPYKSYKPSSQVSGGGALEPQHRSLSLPKSFQAKESLSHRYTFDCTEKIFSFLSNEDLRTVMTACETPSNMISGGGIGLMEDPGAV